MNEQLTVRETAVPVVANLEKLTEIGDDVALDGAITNQPSNNGKRPAIETVTDSPLDENETGGDYDKATLDTAAMNLVAAQWLPNFILITIVSLAYRLALAGLVFLGINHIVHRRWLDGAMLWAISGSMALVKLVPRKVQFFLLYCWALASCWFWWKLIKPWL